MVGSWWTRTHGYEEQVHQRRSKLKWKLVLMVVSASMIAEVDREEQDEVLSGVLVQKTIEQKMDLPLKEKKNQKLFFHAKKKAHFRYNLNSHLLEEGVRLAPFLVSLSLFYIFSLEVRERHA